MEKTKSTEKQASEKPAAPADEKQPKTRQGSGYLKQLYSTARTTAGSTHTGLKNTTFMVNFVPVDKVDASELQVRVHFDDSEIAALAHSIKEHGVLQPILVVQDGDRYKVIAGERRLRASKLAGIERIPARVLSTNDKATHEIALRENLDRVDLHPIEEGEGYVSLLEAQAYTSHDSIAKAFGKKKSRVTECIQFTRLPDTTKEQLMKLNIKNRSLLRQLLITPPEQHASIIGEAAAKEEVLQLAPAEGAAAVGSAVSGETPATEAVKKPKREPAPFQWDLNKKGLSVPGFKWKAGEGVEKLTAYADSIRRMLGEIDARLATPKS